VVTNCGLPDGLDTARVMPDSPAWRNPLSAGVVAHGELVAARVATLVE
jgi:hypothetical protein